MSYSVMKAFRSLASRLRHSKLDYNSIIESGKPPPGLVIPASVSLLREFPENIEKPKYALPKYVFERLEQPEIKTESQIQHMREACQLARKILDATASQLKVGMETDKIDEIVNKLCIQHKVYPSPLLYKGFPKSVCTSVNNVLCHGIPDSRQLEDGDIISIDITVFHNGYHGDVAETYLIGNVDEKGRDLVKTTKDCLYAGMSAVAHEYRLHDIGVAIETVANGQGYNVVPDFCGHGIGTYFHGPPDILHFDHFDHTEAQTGMTFTIEPILSEGSPEFVILEDGWTAVSADGSRTAQFEHTILVTEEGAEILTL